MVNTRNGSVTSLSHNGEHISDCQQKGGKSTTAPQSFLVDEDGPSPCGVCKKEVGEKGIMCDRCNVWVHFPCSKLKAVEYKSLTSMASSSIRWFCARCTYELDNKTDRDARMAAQESKIDMLYQIITTLQQQNNLILQLVKQNNETVEKRVREEVREVMGEEKEKEWRRKNVILFNLPETRDKGASEKVEDGKRVDDVMKEIGVDVGEYETARLGAPDDKRVKPRPLKVTVKIAEKRDEILRKARNLKDSEEYRKMKVGITADKTLEERKKDKALVDEKKRREEQGEDVIIFRGEVMTKDEANKKGRRQPASETGAAAALNN